MSTEAPPEVEVIGEDPVSVARGEFHAAQTAKAHSVRLRDLARSNYLVRDLLEEHEVRAVALDELRKQHNELRASHEGLSAEASRLSEANAALATEATALREQLAAALKPKR